MSNVCELGDSGEEMFLSRTEYVLWDFEHRNNKYLLTLRGYKIRPHIKFTFQHGSSQRVETMDNNTTKLYISYRDAMLHKDVRLGPFPSDINAMELVKMIRELPKSAIGQRVVIDQKDIDFGSKEYLNIQFRN